VNEQRLSFKETTYEIAAASLTSPFDEYDKGIAKGRMFGKNFQMTQQSS
jgi:hypothetical protein